MSICIQNLQLNSKFYIFQFFSKITSIWKLFDFFIFKSCFSIYLDCLRVFYIAYKCEIFFVHHYILEAEIYKQSIIIFFERLYHFLENISIHFFYIWCPSQGWSSSQFAIKFLALRHFFSKRCIPRVSTRLWNHPFLQKN